MEERPAYVDISAASSRAASSVGTHRPGQPSPRIQHYDGEIPPVLSPLDAFAAESRRLAKELEVTRRAGERRLSRLPPAVITKSLSQHNANRPACFRSLSGASIDPVPTLPRQDSFAAGNSPEVFEPLKRPQSSYPRISAVVRDEDEDETFETSREHGLLRQPNDYFEIQRTQSPNSVSDHPHQLPIVSRSASNNSQTQASAGLAPPSAPFARGKQYHESSDDDYTSSNAGSTFSHPLPRKLSNGSGMSLPASPAFPYHARSPSTKSNDSMSSLNKSKQPFNFSRPLSQSSLHPDSPPRGPSRNLERKPSHLSDTSRNLTSFEDDRSVFSDGFLTGQSGSYSHKKFVLPRGKLSEKAAERVSQLFSGLTTQQFTWQEPMFPGTPPLSAHTDNGLFETRSPIFRPSLDPCRPSLDPALNSISHGGFSFDFELDPKPKPSIEQERPSSSRTLPESSRPAETLLQRPSTSHNNSHNAPSFDRPFMPALPTIPGSTADDMSMKSFHKTEQSQSTIRPTTARSHSDYQALSADEHVDKAIELHQNGDLKESTYHLRIAAKQNHPTGMLLYALACRHGWGMRANPAEGVALLRRAVDIAMQEVAEDEDAINSRSKTDALEKKAHKAQFALGIYELGISHLNGWGVEQDKALALRCFEIAAAWGDADAMTEAGFCYAQGVGCKKNPKKAAKFYRLAAEKGASMIGNSWIYKSKYDDDGEDEKRARKQSTTEGNNSKKRNKSRTRSIFGRKRGTTVANGTAQAAEL
ncbi:hypothetical protein H2198_005957 [Neophaeococcomyces mojaviensis]|uniref:Uncharacterized protein n=1 Tax=Neophaeococcomyces mojaviensis TaxID=3383035 RepID=A0ACC3A470_9EURO|nr:hypothetical protein H2198_005957 [Knufia sp. JES_112]